MRKPQKLLRLLLMKRGLKQRVFALSVGIHESSLSAIMAGRRKVPLKTAEKWADVLGLSRVNREAFLDAIHLVHASERVRAMVARLERDIKRLRKHLHR